MAETAKNTIRSWAIPVCGALWLAQLGGKMTEQAELKLFVQIKMPDGNVFDIVIRDPQTFQLSQMFSAWKASDFLCDDALGLALVYPPLWARVVHRILPIQQGQPPQETKQ